MRLNASAQWIMAALAAVLARGFVLSRDLAVRIADGVPRYAVWIAPLALVAGMSAYRTAPAKRPVWTYG
jgi:hypothetical protein